MSINFVWGWSRLLLREYSISFFFFFSSPNPYSKTFPSEARSRRKHPIDLFSSHDTKGRESRKKILSARVSTFFFSLVVLFVSTRSLTSGIELRFYFAAWVADFDHRFQRKKEVDADWRGLNFEKESRIACLKRVKDRFKRLVLGKFSSWVLKPLWRASYFDDGGFTLKVYNEWFTRWLYT